MTALTLHLPWPPRALSPNRKPAHWAITSKARNKYRKVCGEEFQAAGLRRVKAESLDVVLTFFPPDARERNIDNVIAAFKSGQDSIADVTGIDDSKFRVAYPLAFAAPIRPRGMVKVELTWNTIAA